MHRLVTPLIGCTFFLGAAFVAACGSSNDDSPGADPGNDGGGAGSLTHDGGVGSSDGGPSSADGGSGGDGGPAGPATFVGVQISPQGAVVQSGSTLQFNASCLYSDGSTTSCAGVGAVTWSTSRTKDLTVSTTGLSTVATDPGAGMTENGYVIVSVAGHTDRADVYSQHPGDSFFQYPTPDYRGLGDATHPPVLTVGSTITIGSGLVINNDASGGQTTGQPFGETCNWTSSNPAVATVDRHGQTTGVSPGTVTISCGRAGNGVYGASKLSGWVSPGNTLDLVVAAPGAGTTTWYVRPDGGTPFVDATSTPAGQCDGTTSAAYPGSGTNQHCALGNLRYLWSDEVTYGQVKWRIAGGDTVLVAPNPKGYNTGLDEASPYANPPGKAFVPITCNGNPYCSMPSIPSGSAKQHTRILGTNYASCHDDSAKTLLDISFSASDAFSVADSQFVDIACFELTDRAQCANNGNYSASCYQTNLDYGRTGIQQSAMTSYVTYTDVFIHGLAGEGINGATGVGVVGNYVHIRGNPGAGLDMDDSPWNSGNISVAGGLTLDNSIIEFSGCTEEYPVVHMYPFVECRDQNTGSYGDGFGTGSTTGDWSFDHDTWRYNFQDGLDLLHSGMQSLTVTNSVSYGNDGQQYKIGGADTVVFQNNVAIHNCDRILSTIGDEPASAIVPGVSGCRASGDGIALAMTGQGSYTYENVTFVGYGSTPYDMFCSGGWDDCSSAASTYRNNIFAGVGDSLFAGGELPGLFYDGSPAMPANGGWAVRDHNLYFGSRYGCPSPLLAGEVCGDPLFATEPAGLMITAENALDSLDVHLTKSSPAAGAGVVIPGLLDAPDGTAKPTPPNIGAY